MKKLTFAFICILLAVLFGLLLYRSATAAPEQVLISCDEMPQPVLSSTPSTLDWNSDTARVFNCYDEKSRTVKGIVYGAWFPPSAGDVSTLWARWTLSYNGQALTNYEYTVTSHPAVDGAPYIRFEFEMPDCLDRSQFRLVTDYHQRDQAGHGMQRDWSGNFYAQSFCNFLPVTPKIPPETVNNVPPCCTTCDIRWLWHDVDGGGVHNLDTLSFVDLAKAQPNTGALFTLWSPDELEGLIVCDRLVEMTNITVKIFRYGALFRDISQDATDRQFKVTCGKLGYLTDTMMIEVTYQDNGCTCAIQKPVKDP